MSVMRQQRRSETFRGGEPPSHIAAAAIVSRFVEEYKQFIAKQRHVIEFPDGYKHEYDIVVGKITHVIEIGDIGDDTKHQLPHKQQLINDGVAKSHIEDNLECVKYIKINKMDSFYKEWVKKKLGF
jgi:hypothetical protein